MTIRLLSILGLSLLLSYNLSPALSREIEEEDCDPIARVISGTTLEPGEILCANQSIKLDEEPTEILCFGSQALIMIEEDVDSFSVSDRCDPEVVLECGQTLCFNPRGDFQADN